jgi:hypothetical protein
MLHQWRLRNSGRCSAGNVHWTLKHGLSGRHTNNMYVKLPQGLLLRAGF